MEKLSNPNLKFLNILGHAINGSLEVLPVEASEVLELMKLANENNLLPLVQDILISTQANDVKDALKPYSNAALGIMMGQAARTHAFIELYEKFDARGVHPVVLKGLICRTLYGKHANHRPSCDEDILIKKEDFPLVREIMEENGYICEFKDVTDETLETRQEITFFNKHTSLHIEVHINPFGKEDRIRTRFNTFFTDFETNAVDVTVSDAGSEVTLRTLSPTEHLLFLVLHFAKHFYSRGVGIRQVADIVLFYALLHDEIDLTMFNTLLKKASVNLLFNDVLIIGNKYFGMDLPVFGQPTAPEELLERLFKNGIFGRADSDQRVGAGFVYETLKNDCYDRPVKAYFVFMRAKWARFTRRVNYTYKIFHGVNADNFDERLAIFVESYKQREITTENYRKARSSSKKHKKLLEKYKITE